MFLAVPLLSNLVLGETPSLFALSGVFKQETTYVYTVTATTKGRSPLSVTLPLPKSWGQLGHREDVISLSVDAEPKPSDTDESTDRWGNSWNTLRWAKPSGKVQVARRVVVRTTTDYVPFITSSPYPVERRALPWAVAKWLWPTQWIQSNRPEIRKLATSLVSNCRMELEAVVKIISWVRANVSYTCSRDICEPVPQVDALFTLRKLKGNCVNFANLTIALLRASGIPARPVSGFVADRRESHALHAWVEAYFPDLGWIAFESANWMPAGNEVPKTFLLPQHITLYRGEGRGVSDQSFTELHTAEFTVLSHPEPRTTLEAEVQPGQAVSWVLTLQGRADAVHTYALEVKRPPGWYASTSERMVTIDPNGISLTRDVLLTVIPPLGAPFGEEATITVIANSEGIPSAHLVATVRVKKP